MAIIRCNNGHYYDDKKFAQCPHCGVLPAMNGNTELKPEKKTGHFSFFSRMKKPIPGAAAFEEDDDKTIALEDDDRTIALEDDDKTVLLEEDDDKTVALEDDSEELAAFAFAEQAPVVQPQESDDEVTAQPEAEEVVPEAEEPVEEPTQEETEPEAAEQEVTAELEETAAEAPAEDEAVAEAAEEPTEEEAVPEPEELSPSDYVVGWLVGIAGLNKGRDYRLYQGFNRIVMRQNRMKLVLQVSEQDDMVGALVYDDSSNRFFLMPQCEGICLNGAPITEAVEIHAGDAITAKEEKFIFVAFCTEERRWDADSETV